MAILHQVAVLGGGRWARVLTETLCRLLPTSTHISMHSVHCSDSLIAWLKDKGLTSRIDVAAKWPQFKRPSSSVAIVSNAARDHESAVRFALTSGVAALVEKPLARTASAACALASAASDRKVRLAAAHVFLFAAYIDRFADFLASKKQKICALRVRWADPALESRYGETKTFDAGLPVFADVLPHVSSILGVLVPEAPQRCNELRLLRGGAEVWLQLTLGSIPCHVMLARGGSRRERTIEVTLDSTTVLLDFTEEPGTVVDAGMAMNADPGWLTRGRPLELMLRAFLQWVAEDKLDARLSTDPALRACALIDQVSNFYNSAMASWLTTRLCVPGDDEQLRYALNEILQSDGPLEPTVLEHERQSFRMHYARTVDRGWIAKLVASINRRAVLNELGLR